MRVYRDGKSSQCCQNLATWSVDRNASIRTGFGDVPPVGVAAICARARGEMVNFCHDR